MKAFLASAADKTLHLLAPSAKIDPRKTRVAFIANPSDLYTKEKWWVEADRKKFQELGYSVTELDLRKSTKASLVGELEPFDIIHVCGGNVLYFISLLQEKDMVDVIRNAVVKSGKIYTGTSAGSMILAPSVELEKYSSESMPEIVGKLKNFKGLNLVDFLIVPHSENPDFIPDTTEYIKHMHEQTIPLLFVYDSQAVWVEDDVMKILNK
jgi:peptidase E